MIVAFNPGFVDITYGTGSHEEWPHRRGHTFEDLVGSDHVEIAVRNCNGDTVFYGKLDLIDVDPDAPSGYATLGPLGGDGVIYVGEPDDILSFGTSMDDNLNHCAVGDSDVLVNSPPTDSVYSTSEEYPCWQYYAVYRITFDPAIFGTDGNGDVCYGDVRMTYVHASPSKTPLETVTVEEGPAPPENENPFDSLQLIPNPTPPDSMPPGGVD